MPTPHQIRFSPWEQYRWVTVRCGQFFLAPLSPALPPWLALFLLSVPWNSVVLLLSCSACSVFT